MPVAVAGKVVYGIKVHVGLGFVPRQVGAVPAGVKGGALLHLQAVAGEVLRRQIHGGGEVFLPPLHGLPRQAVDEVQGQVADFCFPGGLHSGADLLHGVYPADGAQFLIAGGLHP